MKNALTTVTVAAGTSVQHQTKVDLTYPGLIVPHLKILAGATKPAAGVMEIRGGFGSQDIAAATALARLPVKETFWKRNFDGMTNSDYILVSAPMLDAGGRYMWLEVSVTALDQAVTLTLDIEQL